MTTKQRYALFIAHFSQAMPDAATELHFSTTFELLCAVMLSAQCTDKRVNEVTPALFRRYPTAELMAKAEPEDMLEFIRSVSYPNSKARHLVEMARMIVTDFKGEIPDTTAELVKLPGVGRKTANVLQAVWFGKAVMAVDTHVYRVAHRMGLVPPTANTPLKVEEVLEKSINKEDIPRAHHWLLLHGRYVCQSAKPECDKCPFGDICPKLLKGSKRE